MASNFDLTGLVRSLQRSEGNQDCFRVGPVDCEQMECAWRELCLYGSDPGVQEEPYGEQLPN